MRVRRRRRGQAGFTLIELMVSLILFSLVISGMLSVAVTMTNGYRSQEVTVAAEGATRSTIDFVANGLRGASPGVSINAIVDLDVAACPTGALKIDSNQATPFVNTSDKLTMVMASGSVVTSLRAAFAGSAGATVAVADASQLAANDFVLITNLDTGHLVHIQSVAGNNITIDTPNCTGVGAALPTGGYSPGALVIRAMRATFSIGSVDGIPVLMMDGDAEGARLSDEPIAEGVEDLEVVVGTDDNGDGVLATEPSPATTTDEWHGNITGDTVVASPTSVRAVRISIVARTNNQFPGVNTYKLGALEDRAANGATDNFRRRTLSTTVEVRNLANSP